MLTVISKTGKIIKQVFVVGRYEITKGEQAGRLIHVVRSVKLVKKQVVQNDYQVITFNDQDGRVICGCVATGDCCHKQESASYDMRRCNSIQPAVVQTHKVAQPVIETADIPATEIEKIAIIAAEYKQHKADVAAQKQAELDAAKVHPNYETGSQRRAAAPLNGSRGFQLCKSWAEIEAEKAAKKAEKQVQEEQEEALPGYFNGCPSVQRREHSKVYNRFHSSVA